MKQWPSVFSASLPCHVSRDRCWDACIWTLCLWLLCCDFLAEDLCPSNREEAVIPFLSLCLCPQWSHGDLVQLFRVCIIAVIYAQDRSGLCTSLVRCVGFCFQSANIVLTNAALNFLPSAENSTHDDKPRRGLLFALAWTCLLGTSWPYAVFLTLPDMEAVYLYERWISQSHVFILVLHIFFCLFVAPGVLNPEPRALCVLDQHSAIDSSPSALDICKKESVE